MLLRFLMLLFLFTWPCHSQEIPTPSLQHQVTDTAGILSAEEQQMLTQQLEMLYQKSSVQMALLIVPTTGNDTIEQFATRVFDQWKLGSASRDDGILLLLAWNDHTVRLEVGYGLEGTITDLQAKNIIHSTMLPSFKLGKVYAGVSAGIKNISDLLVKDPGSVVPLQPMMRFPHILPAFFLWGVGLFILPFFVFRKSSFWGRIIKSGAACSALFGLGSLFGAYLFDYVLMFIISEVLLLFASARLIDRSNINKSQKKGTKNRKVNQSPGISTYSSSESSNSISSNNFSGDGGNSGGGGASDRW